MEPSSNFHSTVLQRPAAMHEYDDGRDGDDRRRRDILNPVQLSDNGPPPTAPAPVSSASPSAVAQPPRHSFNLRSPTQPDLHHHPGGPHFPTSTAASPSSAAVHASSSTSNGTRSLLHNPFLTGTTAPPPSLPPPILPSAAAPPPRSPLHAPPVFYPQDMRDPPPSREKTAGSFYDPTTDTTTSTKDRRLSDTGSSWHNATQAQTSAPASKVSNFGTIPSFFFFLHAFCSCDAAINRCLLWAWVACSISCGRSSQRGGKITKKKKNKANANESRCLAGVFFHLTKMAPDQSGPVPRPSLSAPTR